MDKKELTIDLVKISEFMVKKFETLGIKKENYEYSYYWEESLLYALEELYDMHGKVWGTMKEAENITKSVKSVLLDKGATATNKVPQAIMLVEKSEPLCIVTKVSSEQLKQLKEYFSDVVLFDLEFDCKKSECLAYSRSSNDREKLVLLDMDNAQQIEKYEQEGWNPLASTDVIRTAKQLEEYLSDWVP